MSETKEMLVNSSWCNTKYEIRKYEFNWTIDDFSFLKTLFMDSPKFPSAESDISFILSIFPKTRQLGVELFVSACKEINLNQFTFIVNIVVASNPKWTFRDKVTFPIIHGTCSTRAWYVDYCDLEKNLPGDKLTIHCVIHIVKDKAFHNLSFNVPKCDLANDLGNLFESKELSDVIIKTSDGHKLRAHKNILSGMLNNEKTLCSIGLLFNDLSPLLARSPVFAAMFKHPMLENQENSVAIADFKHDVVAEMLRFIYTGYAPKLPEICEDLLAAADKYAIERLKKMCGGYLSNNLSVKTAHSILKLADLYNMPELKKRSKQFVNIHCQDTSDFFKPEEPSTIYKISESIFPIPFLELCFAIFFLGFLVYIIRIIL